MRYYTYILAAPGQRRTYVGWTTDLEKRLAAHNAGKGAKATRGRAWILAYAEQYPTRHEAMSREYHLRRNRKLRAALLD